ncbi:MAG: DNA mismatch repair protein MutS [Bacilli bacterium]
MITKEEKMKYSPMIRQYLDVKENYPDTILFYRVGDFYEMFFEDAVIGSKVLEIVLTGKDVGVSEKAPMCGVPYHAVDKYLQGMVEHGYKVAIVEQIGDLKCKGIVTREVVRIVTPGTEIDNATSSKRNNFIVSVSFDKGNKSNSRKDRFILSYLDLSTGEGYITNIPSDQNLLYAEIMKLESKEIVISSKLNQDIFKDLLMTYNIMISREDNDVLPSYFKSLIVGLDAEEIKCYAMLLNYIVRTQKRNLVHMQNVVKYDINSYMKIDLSSRRNLELLETLRFQNKKNTLMSVLDKTSTAMGSRCLHKNILFPLIDKYVLESRYDVIDSMKKHFLEISDLRKELEQVYDLERIVGKISYENANPRDLLQLERSLIGIKKIGKLVKKIGIDKEFDLYTDSDKYQEIYSLLFQSIADNAPMLLKDGGVIKSGYCKDLDEARDFNIHSKDYILSIEQNERKRTGINNLHIGYNKVFGYYIEVSKLRSKDIKDEFGYIRKQTTTNNERYITQELKEKESLVLRAEDKIIALENKLYIEIRNKCKNYTYVLQSLSKTIAKLDMMASFTYITNANKYVRPTLTEDGIIEIKEGRHPVLEANLGDRYIPNDVILDNEKFLMMITGPNMSGKSTYMRQVALTSIMAQIGCFVPAKSAKICIFDQIFTRIGASDDIASGQSTFMVEMSEVNNALQSATSNSLILFDEIGRGTATFDGMALAQAIIEYVHDSIKCKTMFSTHYHELTSLEEDMTHMINVHVSAEEDKGQIIFLHKVKKGAIDKSYGINVAKLAHIPTSVLIRANDILIKLMDNENYDLKKLSMKNYQAPLVYDSKSDAETYALDQIRQADLYSMSPLDAMNFLNEIKKKL